MVPKDNCQHGGFALKNTVLSANQSGMLSVNNLARDMTVASTPITGISINQKYIMQ